MASEYDGAWTKHEGRFDQTFFKDFTTTPNGFVYKKLNSPETEKPVPFQKVFVQYTGYLEDGTKFDSSYDKGGGQPFSFRLGKGKVIPGWEATVGGMTVGQQVSHRMCRPRQSAANRVCVRHHACAQRRSNLLPIVLSNAFR